MSGPALKRSLGPVAVMLLVFSALSPAFSVYIAGDAVLHIAGTGAALAFLLGGVATAVVALLYAEIGAAFPGAGGVYPSLAALLGRFLAFPYIILLAPVAFANVAFTALGLGDYVRVLAPGIPLLGVAFLGLAAATFIAILNIRFGALVTGIFLSVEAASLAVLCGVALLNPARSLPALFAHPVMIQHGALAPVPVFTLALAAVAGMYACGGASWALYFAEEMHDVRRTIGRVIAWTGVLASVTIAGPMILMLLSARDLPAVLAAEAPMAAFLRLTGGPVISAVVSAGVAAAIFNCLVATVMAYGRYFYATGRDGIWPGPVNRLLASVHTRSGAPVVATLLLAALSAVAVLFGEKALLILISGNVSDYVLVSLAVIVGRRQRRTGQDFAAPLHPMIPIFGFCVAASAVVADWLDPDAGRPSTILLTTLFVGALAYYHFRLRQVSRAWVIGGADPEALEPAE